MPQLSRLACCLKLLELQAAVLPTSLETRIETVCPRSQQSVSRIPCRVPVKVLKSDGVGILPVRAVCLFPSAVASGLSAIADIDGFFRFAVGAGKTASLSPHVAPPHHIEYRQRHCRHHGHGTHPHPRFHRLLGHRCLRGPAAAGHGRHLEAGVGGEPGEGP